MSDDKTRILTADEAARLPLPAADEDDRTRILSKEEAARIQAPSRTEDGGSAAAGADGAARATQRPAAAAPHKAAKKSAARHAAPEPQFVGDRIVFFCANGHRISVERRLAGKKGKCSKQGCGVPVLIPVPADSEPAEELLLAAPAPEAETPGVSPAAPPGEMPEETLGGTPAEASGESPAAASAPADDFFALEVERSPEAEAEPPPEADEAWGGFDIEEIDNPTARLVARLWMERAHGGVVEVHLSGGSVIMPEWYDPRWSCGTHALFAAQAADGTVTLTAVAWDQIQKVVVRQVQGTPDGMFEA